MGRIPHRLVVLLHLPVQAVDHLLLVFLLVLISAPTVPRPASATVLPRRRRRERHPGNETRLPAAPARAAPAAAPTEADRTPPTPVPEISPRALAMAEPAPKGPEAKAPRAARLDASTTSEGIR